MRALPRRAPTSWQRKSIRARRRRSTRIRRRFCSARLRARVEMMARQLYELAGSDPARLFSPYCWRTRMALAHKGLDFETVPWRFAQKDTIQAHGSEKVPVLVDGEARVNDSWAIAEYLEDTYPARPSLFGGEGGRGMARHLNNWRDVSVGQISPFIIAAIHNQLDAGDKDYIRRTREKNFGKPLEEVIAGRA